MIIPPTNAVLGGILGSAGGWSGLWAVGPLQISCPGHNSETKEISNLNFVGR